MRPALGPFAESIRARADDGRAAEPEQLAADRRSEEKARSKEPGHLSQVIRPPHHRLVPFPAPTEEIRAKNGNRRLPLSGGGETQAQTDAAIARLDSLAAWRKSSAEARSPPSSLEIPSPDQKGGLTIVANETK